MYGQRPPKPENPRGRSWGCKQWPLDPPVAHFEDRGTLYIQMLCTRPEHDHDHVWHAPYKAMGDCGGSCVPAVVAYFGKAAKNVVDPALVIPLLLEAPNGLLRSLALEGVTVASPPPSLASPSPSPSPSSSPSPSPSPSMLLAGSAVWASQGDVHCAASSRAPQQEVAC
jgi:hypothetical protein